MERATRVALGDIDLAVPQRPARSLTGDRNRSPRRPNVGRRVVAIDIRNPRPVRDTADHVQILAGVGEGVAHVRAWIGSPRHPVAAWWWRRWRRWRWRWRRRWRRWRRWWPAADGQRLGLRRRAHAGVATDRDERVPDVRTADERARPVQARLVHPRVRGVAEGHRSRVRHCGCHRPQAATGAERVALTERVHPAAAAPIAGPAAPRGIRCGH